MREKLVALFTRAWIEMQTQTSLPVIWVKVALFTRAWIEIKSVRLASPETNSRPLYEGVD